MRATKPLSCFTMYNVLVAQTSQIKRDKASWGPRKHHRKIYLVTLDWKIGQDPWDIRDFPECMAQAQWIIRLCCRELRGKLCMATWTSLNENAREGCLDSMEKQVCLSTLWPDKPLNALPGLLSWSCGDLAWCRVSKDIWAYLCSYIVKGTLAQSPKWTWTSCYLTTTANCQFPLCQTCKGQHDMYRVELGEVTGKNPSEPYMEGATAHRMLDGRGS